MAEPAIKAFVCGHPVAHSRSPLIHGYWLEQYELNGTYELVDVAPADFAAFLSNLKSSGFAGGNITIPHKEAAFRIVAESDDAARKIGAINTVWLEGETLCGTNTDWFGFAANLDASIPGWDNIEQAVVIGAGGAARGILYALIQRGIQQIRIVNRTRSRAEDLAREFRARKGPVITVYDFAEMARALTGAELLVNTTSLGMAGNSGEAPDLSVLASKAVVADIVYVPLETPLLAAARKIGRKTVDGLGMLLHQAVPGFEKWFGRRPDVTSELRALVVRDMDRQS